MIILCNTLLPNVAVIGSTIEPTPVFDKTTDIVVAAILTTMSTDSNNVVGVLDFCILFRFLTFIF